VKIMRVVEVRDRFAADGFDPVGSTPEEFGQFIRDEIPKWAKLVKSANIRAE
jgi:tripartite-type tricarboxylate transporter receptor subunit TctC